MEEKILIKSEKYNVKKLVKILSLIGLAITLIMIIVGLLNDVLQSVQTYNEHTQHDFFDCVSPQYQEEIWDRCYDYLENQDVSSYITWEHDITYYAKEYVLCNDENTYMLGDGCPKYYPNAFSYAMAEWWDDFIAFYYGMICLIPVVALTIIGALIYLWLNSYKLTVSDKKVSGEVLFGKKIDLPIDSVSATSVISLFKGVRVSTSSGKISFLAIKNATEIYQAINNLLVERQKSKPKTETTTIVQNSDEADMLKKYKDLLDSGVITQEEFDAKKKQLLGL